MGHDDDDDDDGNASLDAEDFMGGTPEELHETLHDEALNITEDLKEFAPPEAKDDTEEHSEQDLTEISYKSIDVTPEPSSASGMRFDEIYRLKGVLGTGAFSTVREGFHRNNRYRSFAVKCINRKKLSEEDEAALLDEVSILKEMRHVHIIRLYDFFEEPSTYYLVMERMRGGELFDRIVAKAYYNEKEARDTCKILLEAVGYCHQNHVAHRDLKPENLLLLSGDDDSAVKIADFGFAKKGKLDVGFILFVYLAVLSLNIRLQFMSETHSPHNAVHPDMLLLRSWKEHRTMSVRTCGVSE